MLKYLLDFGIKTEIDKADISLNYEIDINDITILQDQLNKTRKIHYDLIKLNDQLQGEYMIKKSALSKKLREFNIDYSNRTERLNAMGIDIDYAEINDSIEAIKEGMRTIGNKLDFVKSDLRILTNSMYRKI